MNLLEELRKPIMWEFEGNESEFEENIFININEIVELMGLPQISAKERQVQIRFNGYQAIMDIVVRHVDGSATIFEVKKANQKHPSTAPVLQMNAIGQLLLYKSVFKAKTNVTPRLVLIDNKIYERTYYAFIDSDLPIALMELQKDRVFIPYRAF